MKSNLTYPLISSDFFKLLEIFKTIYISEVITKSSRFYIVSILDESDATLARKVRRLFPNVIKIFPTVVYSLDSGGQDNLSSLTLGTGWFLL